MSVSNLAVLIKSYLRDHSQDALCIDLFSFSFVILFPTLKKCSPFYLSQASPCSGTI